MSVSSLSISRLVDPACSLAQHAAPEANAAPPVAAQAQVQPSPARHMILFWGPGLPLRDCLTMEKKCQQLGVNLRVIPIASRADFSDELKNALYLGGELVGGTQVIACFHGGGLRGQDRHELEVANGGAECVDTLDFLSWLRTAPEGMPCGPEPAGFRGTVHLPSCGANLLTRHLQPGTPAWNQGTTFAYSSCKATSYHQGISTMLDLCDLVGAAVKAQESLDPMTLAARAVGISGDTVACLGAGFHEAFIVRAPRTPKEAHADYVIHNLELGEQCTKRISGSQQDRTALLAVMKRRYMTDNTEERSMARVHNTLSTRTCRLKLEQTDALLKRYPYLAAMQDVDGISGAQERHTLQETLNRNQATIDAATATGAPKTLGEALATLANSEPTDKQWRRSVVQAVRQRPEMQKAAMRWALLNYELPFFCDLLDSRDQFEPNLIVNEFFPCALQGGASMALSFLQALINPGPLSTAACIAAGIRAGAPKPVISQWLSAEEWWRFERGTVEVMNAAMNAGIVDFLLDQVAEHLPHAIDPVFHVLRQNEKPLMTTIKRLYQLAKTRGNDGLCVKIQQAFPSTVPVSGGSSKGKAPASGRSQRRLST